MRTIDADELRKAKNLPEAIERIARGTSKDTLAAYMMGWNDALDAAADNAPTIEAFTREELENWLYTICYNNIDGNEEDMKFAKHTEEIIRRLDGFERYVKDKREGKI